MTESFKPIDGTTTPTSVKPPKIPKIIHIVEEYQLEEILSRQFGINESDFKDIVSKIWEQIDLKEKQEIINQCLKNTELEKVLLDKDKFSTIQAVFRSDKLLLINRNLFTATYIKNFLKLNPFGDVFGHISWIVEKYCESLSRKYTPDFVKNFPQEHPGEFFSFNIRNFTHFFNNIDQELKGHSLLQETETNETQKREKEALIDMLKFAIKIEEVQHTFISEFENVMLQKLKEKIEIVGDKEIKTEEEKNKRVKEVQKFASSLDLTIIANPEILKHFTDEEMEKYKARIKDGKFVDEKENELNDINYRFILRSTGELYFLPPTIKEVYPFYTRHSSHNFSDVIAAGTLHIKNGIIWSVSNESGHYKPGLSAIRKLADALVSLIPDSEQRKLHTYYYNELRKCNKKTLVFAKPEPETEKQQKKLKETKAYWQNMVTRTPNQCRYTFTK